MNLDKASIRKIIKEQRQALTSEFCQLASTEFTLQCNRLNLSQHSHIAVYLSHGNEINLSGLIKALWQQDKLVYLPVLAERQLKFAAYYPQTKLLANQFGILEPVSQEIIDPQKLNVIFMPLLAFDISGNRLGMGKGYYDHTLANLKPKPLLIGCGYEFQRLETLPTKAWDVKLDLAITEQTIYDFRIQA